MVITHILADGTKKTDLTGHVVKDLHSTYEIIAKIKRRLENEQHKHKLKN